ncbi:NAD(P)H:quinone oxidoreductase [Vibrio sonorensis]|uniref:NAD(P)H:quinone oxidoreductase n=1 Tax=Vibrio sonorensis TaxID=1004316 RepID=UPI00158699AF|nr:NAD(P)H:quinone oxidoreductase [Vibrio sonorensis]
MTEVVVLYYSRHGATRDIARHIARGIESVPQCQALLRTVEEIDSAANKDGGDPIVSFNELKQSDGLAMGSPVWFGNMAAPLKHFWDKTTAIWVSGELIDKPACVFTSSSTLHGGQESTLLSMMLPLFHHGMMVMGTPYSEPELHLTQSGGTPYGPTTVSGHQQRVLTKEEIALAQATGKRLATTAKKMKET